MSKEEKLNDDLIFTCPDCGKHRLECCEDGAYSSEVIGIDEEGDFDYGEIDASGIVVRFQCLECGFILTRKFEGCGEYDITNVEEVIKWIKENCEQPESYIGHRGKDDNADS